MDAPRSALLSGHTLLELAVALGLLALALSAALPAAGGLADDLAVRGARESLAALGTRVRSEALRHGGARLRIDSTAGTARVVAGGVEWERVDLGRDYGVEVVLTGGAAAAELYYDALGIGRVASLTVRFARGDASAALAFSAYGRVRRLP